MQERQDTVSRPRLLVATGNVSKGKEILEILRPAGLDLEVVTLADFPPMEEVEETGETFMENAHLKASAALAHTAVMALSDDGGLVINALDGQPGVKSRRFLGEETPFTVKMERILEMMRDVPEEQRTCRFQCAVVIAFPDGTSFECLGTCEGRIGYEQKGQFGFGYDAIVYIPEKGVHMAELPPEEKHKISHRGKALAQAIAYLRGRFSTT